MSNTQLLTLNILNQMNDVLRIITLIDSKVFIFAYNSNRY